MARYQSYLGGTSTVPPMLRQKFPRCVSAVEAPEIRQILTRKKPIFLHRPLFWHIFDYRFRVQSRTGDKMLSNFAYSAFRAV